MPSQAYNEYHKNLIDVRKLISLHRQMSGTRQGKRGLGHLTRGGLLLLCAAWERYIETMLCNGTDFLISRLADFKSLPAVPRKTLTDHVNSNSTSWVSADLATSKWTQIYREVTNLEVKNLNTPKYAQIKKRYEDLLNVSDIGAAWSISTTDIDQFVSLRGDIAHRGAQGPYIQFGELLRHESKISKCVIDTDNYLHQHLYSIVKHKKQPWQKIG